MTEISIAVFPEICTMSRQSQEIRCPIGKITTILRDELVCFPLLCDFQYDGIAVRREGTILMLDFLRYADSPLRKSAFRFECSGKYHTGLELSWGDKNRDC
jgi:hypothetical protein